MGDKLVKAKILNETYSSLYFKDIIWDIWIIDLKYFYQYHNIWVNPKYSLNMWFGQLLMQSNTTNVSLLSLRPKCANLFLSPLFENEDYAK